MNQQQFEQIRKDFEQSSLYLDMMTTIEDSPWHREDNVAVHTRMVVDEYLKFFNRSSDDNFWLGALACLFHDVGKPIVEQVKENNEIGVYRSYAGHELTSARRFEDYALCNLDLTPKEILQVGWMIQNHLPYKIKDRRKKQALVNTAFQLDIAHIFPLVLLADQLGRTSDNHSKNIREVEEWIAEFNNTTPIVEIAAIDAPKLYMLIGPSGAGKSTFTRDILKQYPDTAYYSWDQLRLDWYGEPGDDPAVVYNKAFDKSCEDKEFNEKVQHEFMRLIKMGKDIVVDNTNLSAKRRKFFAQEAQKKGYLVQGIVFMVKREDLLKRLRDRPDRNMNELIVINMHENMTYPNVQLECDIIIPRFS